MRVISVSLIEDIISQICLPSFDDFDDVHFVQFIWTHLVADDASVYTFTF